jgi:hypothetical protein
MIPAFPALLLFGLLTPSIGADTEEAAVLLRRVIDSRPERQEREREYVFRQTTTTRELNKDGSVRTAKSETYLVTPGPGGEYRRLVAKNGRPLSPKEESREERKFREFLEEQMRLPENERTSRTKDKVKSRVERYQSRLEEALEVFDFERRPDASANGVVLRVFDFRPKPGYEGHSRPTKILARIEGTVWIDPERDQLARLQVRFREDLSFLGGIFGRVSKGSEATAEATLADGLWLLDRIEVRLNARFYFLKRYHQNIVVDYDDYRKFQVETEERLMEPTSPLP